MLLCVIQCDCTWLCCMLLPDTVDVCVVLYSVCCCGICVYCGVLDGVVMGCVGVCCVWLYVVLCAAMCVYNCDEKGA